jgi:hypothetical protein
MPASSNARAMAVLAATGALLLAVFAAAPQAEASTLYACVKSKSGTARVFTKKPKCKKGESKISWNTAGPAGKNGSNGTNGTNGATGATGANGANGAVAGYSASKSAAVNIIGGTLEAPVVILTKTIPAGSYIVFAKSVIATGDTSNGAKWTAQCDLTDKPASGTSTVDTSTASGEVVTNFLFHTGFAALPLGMAITTTTESTLTLACTEVWNTSATGKFEMSATNSLITALQTSHNG